ncbi:MAG: hypothetical protein LBJ89_02600 [Holosporales bacterium]|jgi:F-type H+-transporting ATPase subunit b|nr:hypothetical protein [Holosporales bacterium]
MDLPQFDSSTFSSQIFWLLLCSLFLLFFVRGVFLPRVVYVLEMREKRIAGDAARTQEIKTATAKLQAEYSEKMQQNRENAAAKQMAKLLEFNELRSAQIAQAQQVFHRKRLAIEKRQVLNIDIKQNFVKVLLSGR